MTAILIAEDEQRISSFVAKGLRSAGFQTTAVGDGREALSHALSGRYDLVLLDVGLPGMDGFQVLERLRSTDEVGSSRVDLQACKLEYSIVSPK